MVRGSITPLSRQAHRSCRAASRPNAGQQARVLLPGVEQSKPASKFVLQRGVARRVRCHDNARKRALRCRAMLDARHSVGMPY